MHADVELCIGETEARHARRPDGHVSFARMLEENDARLRLERGDVPAITDALGPSAARANGAIRARIRERHRGYLPRSRARDRSCLHRCIRSARALEAKSIARHRLPRV